MKIDLSNPYVLFGIVVLVLMVGLIGYKLYMSSYEISSEEVGKVEATTENILPEDIVPPPPNAKTFKKSALKIKAEN